MPQSVDVGSVLGGRYKVTAHVLASADQDLVLEGVDQVLNRPVSILVAAPANASQVAASAREIATGERPGSMQVLDLGISEGQTYLVTNQAPAPDLLDLVITQDAPYVEPFFTDTLGSEIFGRPRSTEPHVYDDDEEYYEEQEARRPVLPNLPQFTELPKPRMPRFRGKGQKSDAGGEAGASSVASTQAGSAPAGSMRPGSAPAGARPGMDGGAAESAGAGGTAAAAAATAAGIAAGSTGAERTAPPRPSTPPREAVDQKATGAEGRQDKPQPKVSLWSEEDYGLLDEGRGPAGKGSDAKAAAGGAAAAGAKPREGGDHGQRRSGQPQRAASTFPSSAVAAGGSFDDYFEEEDVETRRRPKLARFLVAGMLALILVGGVVWAVSQLGGMFREPVAGPVETATQAQQSPEATAAPTETAQQAVEPVATNVTRLVPGNQNLNAETDSDLPNVVDGNPATFWASYFYSSDAFGGLAQNIALVVELEEEADITQVDITQVNGTGGNFTVRLNDQPTLDGSRQVGQGSFTAPRITIPVDETNGEASKAKYVIVDFTRLPRTSAPSAPFPFGLQIAEVKVS